MSASVTSSSSVPLTWEKHHWMSPLPGSAGGYCISQETIGKLSKCQTVKDLQKAALKIKSVVQAFLTETSTDLK